MLTFWSVFALKATLWAAATYVAALAVPAQHPQARRALALLGIWGAWLVPWLRLPQSGVSLPFATDMEVNHASMGWMILAAVWLLGTVILLLRLLREAAGIEKLVRHAESSPLRLSLPVDVRFSREVAGPCMTGWWSPCVLLPQEAALWPEPALQAALRHECQHARQHDGLHRVGASLLRAVFWWNPAVHALCGIYEAESEVCCDLEASAQGVSRSEYGELLLAHATGLPLRHLAMPFARHSGLRARIERLLAKPRDSRWLISARCAVAVLLVTTAGLLVAAVRVADPVMPLNSAMEAEAMVRLSADPFPGSP